MYINDIFIEGANIKLFFKKKPIKDILLLVSK
jgi:hypothetical protein